jgi:hypothetical protein
MGRVSSPNLSSMEAKNLTGAVTAVRKSICSNGRCSIWRANLSKLKGSSCLAVGVVTKASYHPNNEQVIWKSVSKMTT